MWIRNLHFIKFDHIKTTKEYSSPSFEKSFALYVTLFNWFGNSIILLLSPNVNLFYIIYKNSFLNLGSIIVFKKCIISSSYPTKKLEKFWLMGYDVGQKSI